MLGEEQELNVWLSHVHFKANETAILDEKGLFMRDCAPAAEDIWLWQKKIKKLSEFTAPFFLT